MVSRGELGSQLTFIITRHKQWRLQYDQPSLFESQNAGLSPPTMFDSPQRQWFSLSSYCCNALPRTKERHWDQTELESFTTRSHFTYPLNSQKRCRDTSVSRL